MLQLAFLRENREQAKEALKRRNFRDLSLVDQLLDLDEDRRAIQVELDNTLSELNKISKEIGSLMKEGKKEEANQIKFKTAQLKDSAKKSQDHLADLQVKQNQFLFQIPNIPHPSVPPGNSDEDNEVVFQVASLPELPSDNEPHWELASKFRLIDFEMGAKITGAGFPVYTGQGARLQRALINYFLDYNLKAGYTEYQPPHLVNEDSGFGTGQLPDKEGQMYHVTEDDLYLIPTAEVPITNIFRDVILEEADFPKKATAYSPCFRREAGSYGAHVRGLNRLHQFDKVEIVRIEKPEDSYKVLDEMVSHVEGLIQSLELPYRILRLCGGDLGFTSALTYDFEVYSAAQKRWLEVSSVSNFESFQANRLKLRYRSKDQKKPQLCHTLNGSALALPRIVAALLENNQNGEIIKMPEVLHPYLGFHAITKI